MPRLSMWRGNNIKTNDYNFFDRTISEYFHVSGTAALVHLYLGPYDQTTDGTNPPPDNTTASTIQDVLFLENRDRKYSSQVYEIRINYNVTDADFDLKQFGLFLSGDTLFLETHLNDMLAMIGRKIMPGDVLELPHQRDDALLDPAAPAINKFYVVSDANRASDGYSPTWFPHIWRLKVSPMSGAQEYSDILNQKATDPFGLTQSTSSIGDLMTTIGNDLALNDAVIAEAKLSLKGRNFESQQYYVVPGNELTSQYPWIWTGDGIPPDGAQLTGSGFQFPLSPIDGDYFLRTDYEPATLFRRTGKLWVIQEVDYRGTDWHAAHRMLINFINDTTTQTFADGTTAPTRVALSKAVLPRADF